MNNTRINELTNQITAFSKEKYGKNEFLQEYLTFEKQVGMLTFNEEHAENAKLRISDVVDYLHKKLENQECNNEISELLERIDNNSRVFSNLIGREKAGTKGEILAQRSLEALTEEHIKLYNVELKKEENKGEIDAVVVTKKAIFLIEVKNSNHDMVIDSRGNYYRARGYMDLDYNIGEKINNKEVLLRNALEQFCKTRKNTMNIVKLVVFANSKINVVNRYKYVEKCYLSQLPHIIDEYEGEDVYTLEELWCIKDCIKNAESKELYLPALDFVQFKSDIATALAIIEESSKEETTQKKDVAIPCFLTREWADKEKENWRYLKLAVGLTGAFAAGVLTHKLYSKR